ncbi:hypothetical protein OIO90_000055 [Microbotryomycetes sp. JL221]|nr:hypothetical protein OIO90_000055 [Microbotryomycetes sp. JL221]
MVGPTKHFGDSANSRGDEQTVRLPLATLLAQARPHHPLVSKVYDPVVPRVANVEAVVHTSIVAQLMRRIGLKHRSISCLACSALVAGVYKYRQQWRAMMGLLGVAEAVCTTFNLLATLEAKEVRQTSHDEGADEQERAEHRIRQEIKHLASFWIVFATLSVLESVRATGISDIERRGVVSSRIRTTLRQLRIMVRRLANKYPHLEFIAPARRSVGSNVRRPFPQPRPLALKAVQPAPAIATWLSSEVKYRVFKLLFLWTMLRRDGLGASAIWEWVFGPLCTVNRTRQVRLDETTGQKRRRVARVVIGEEDDTHVPQAVSPRQDPARIEDSPSISTSPAYTRHSYNSSREYSTNDTSFSPSVSSSQTASYAGESPFVTSAGGNSAFPTPNVPFRLTSSSHPIRATVAQDMASIHASASTIGDSPTPSSRHTKGFDLGASIDNDKSWIGTREWAS